MLESELARLLEGTSDAAFTVNVSIENHFVMLRLKTLPAESNVYKYL